MSVLPPDFLWGWASAATEYEGGGLENSWTRWLAANAERLARDAGPGQSPVWDLVRGQATDPANYRVGAAVDHWHRYAEDYRLARSLGFEAAQITVDWSRVERVKGHYDDAALAHYREMVQSLRRHGQEPFVQLWHFGDPLWLDDGWADPEAPERFGRYARHVAEALGDLVTYWITINEPKVYTFSGFLQGIWPPGRRNPAMALRVARNLLRGHRLAADALKAVSPQAQVGVPVNNVLYGATAGPLGPVDRLIEKGAHGYQNELFRSALMRHCDWLGLNYYVRMTIRRLRVYDCFAGGRRNDLGWDLVPGGVENLLMRAARYRKPMFVTEFGLADCRDLYRGWYVEQTLLAIGRAIARGADVRGAFYWSLLDNLEWDKGYWPRYGMVEVDRTTLERRVRGSAHAARESVNRLRGRPEAHPHALPSR